MPYTDEQKEELFGIPDTHPSYAVVNLSRPSGTGRNLFGSSIRHSHTICLTISHAEITRNLSNDWIHGTEEIIEVEMSENQFAQLVASAGVGEGVPVTLRHIEGKRMPNPPEVKKVQQFRKEFETHAQKIFKNLSGLMEQAAVLKTRAVTAAERKEIANTLDVIRAEIESNLPFVLEQFQDQMEKSQTEARAEIEAHIDHVVRRVGLAGLQKELKKELLGHVGGEDGTKD